MGSKFSRRDFLKKSAVSLAAVTIPNTILPGMSEAAGSTPDALVLIQLAGGLDPLLMFPLTGNVSYLNSIRSSDIYINPATVSVQLQAGLGIHPAFNQFMNSGANPYGYPNYLNHMKVIPQVGNAFLNSPEYSHEEATIIMTTCGVGNWSDRIGWTARLYDNGVRMRGFYGSPPFYNCQTCDLPPVVTSTYEDLDTTAYRLYTSSDETSNWNNTKHVVSVLEKLSGYKTKATGATDSEDPVDFKPGRPIGEMEDHYRKSQRAMFHAIDKIVGKHGVVGTLSPTYKSPLWDEYGAHNQANNGGFEVNGTLLQQFRNIAQTLNEMRMKQDGSKIIFIVEIAGFDIHANWAPSGNGLMWNLASGLRIFMNDLHRMNLFNNTAMFLCTEFGRTIKTGYSGSGTDHGLGYTTCVLGGKVNAGVHGHIFQAQELATYAATKNVWPREVAQESIISELIKNHLKLDPTIVFPADYLARLPQTNLNLFRA